MYHNNDCNLKIQIKSRKLFCEAVTQNIHSFLDIRIQIHLSVISMYEWDKFSGIFFVVRRHERMWSHNMSLFLYSKSEQATNSKAISEKSQHTDKNRFCNSIVSEWQYCLIWNENLNTIYFSAITKIGLALKCYAEPQARAQYDFLLPE